MYHILYLGPDHYALLRETGRTNAHLAGARFWPGRNFFGNGVYHYPLDTIRASFEHEERALNVYGDLYRLIEAHDQEAAALRARHAEELAVLFRSATS